MSSYPITKKVIFWEILTCFFIMIAGSLLHYVFDLTGGSLLLALFSPVNESSWEHYKLGFWPALLMLLIEYRFVKDQVGNYFLAKALGILILFIMISVFFYGFRFILGGTSLALSIGSFCGGVIVSQAAVILIYTNWKKNPPAEKIGIALLILLPVLFAIFTFFPPKTGLFLDEKRGFYGLPVHSTGQETIK